jgi:hypothetical protein
LFSSADTAKKKKKEKKLCWPASVLMSAAETTVSKPAQGGLIMLKFFVK